MQKRQLNSLRLKPLFAYLRLSQHLPTSRIESQNLSYPWFKDPSLYNDVEPMVPMAANQKGFVRHIVMSTQGGTVFIAGPQTVLQPNKLLSEFFGFN